MAEFQSPEVTPADDLQPTCPPAPRKTSPPSSPDTIFDPVLDPVSAGVKTWGDFQLLQRIGQGAFGEVYRAWDPVLEREIALKLLLPRGLNPDEEYASIVSEARAIARVRHPNIVSVYGVDRRERRVGFWSDFVRGQTLSALVATQGTVDAKTAAQIGTSLCDALAAVHAAGLLHRDIKAGNAMRDENGRILLMDFGLSQDLSRTGDSAGTPGYIAPEIRAGRPATVQSDLYALGVLLRFLTTGDVAPLPMARSVDAASGPGLAGRLDEIVRKATERDPKLRYASAAQMREALSSLIETPSQTGPSVTPAQAASSRGFWLGLLALILLAVIVLSAPRIARLMQPSAPLAGSAAYQGYLAAQNALLRYDKPGNTQKAIALYQSTLQRAPNFALAEAGLARAYWRIYLDTSDNKWVEEATQASAKAVAMNPNLAEVQMTAGTIHVDQGEFDLGSQELQQAEQLDHRSADVHAALSEAYRQQGRTADAKNELQTAIDLAPDNWKWPYLLGALEIDSGDFPAAEQSLKAALANTPDNARILYNLGIVYRKEDRLPEAESALQSSIALDPRADSMMVLGHVYLLQETYRKAIDMYLRAVQLNDSSWEAWGNLAAAYEWSGDYPAEATDAYRKAIQLALEEIKNTPEDPYLISMLGKFYANLHNEKSAMPYIRKSLVLAPSDPDILERAAESYEALGHRQQAIKLLGQALKLGFPVVYAKSDSALKALRQDPDAPEAIREVRHSMQQKRR
ncbi:MAG: protein kinase [Terracidiphilus sp.]